MKTKLLFILLIPVMISCTRKSSGNAENSKENTMEIFKAELEMEIPASLGEGAIWNHETNTFWWVDIEGRKLNIYDPMTKSNRVIDVKERIGTVVPAKSGGAIVALENGIFHLDLESEEMKMICNPLEELDTIRFNDGKCDPAGRLWVGSMSLKFIKGAASLYTINPDGSYRKVFGGVTVSNGIIWSNDHKTLYYIDTPVGNVRAWDYDLVTGDISNERVLISIPEGMGGPDGMTIDKEGKLWIAMWGGNQVSRWDPENGELIGKVEVPAPNVTSCAFGGPDLDVLYITTAGGDNQKMKEDYPLAGSVFKVKPGVKGVRADFFGE
ncbi:MAG: SMP-30/gluconolactonase/LRE family protein [Cyclobacteriaceae bacterium]|jgi:sugar lactone lactonase YvrE